MHYRVTFDEMEWETKFPGHRQKKFVQNGKQIRLLEVTPEFVEQEWCTKGHNGFVLEGVIELEFDNESQLFRAGDALIIPVGAEDRHKSRALTAIVRLIMVEDV